MSWNPASIIVGKLECNECYAIVSADRMGLHLSWHRKLVKIDNQCNVSHIHTEECYEDEDEP